MILKTENHILEIKGCELWRNGIFFARGSVFYTDQIGQDLLSTDLKKNPSIGDFLVLIGDKNTKHISEQIQEIM